jgi:putative tryptophan/tyrosine transport system substrate-binding protein
MRRRRFISLLAVAAGWPLTGRAQQPDRIPRVGVLMPWPENDAVASVTAFAGALGRLGWVEGKNIRIDYRFAANDPALFKTYAAELVGLTPDAILASTPPALIALRERTRTIPIVFVLVLYPVGLGVVQSLAQPGGNITGFGALDPPMMGKWLQLLKEVAPNVARVAVIFNPDTQPYATLFNRAIETAALSYGTTVTLAPVHDDVGIEEAIAAQAPELGAGLICLPDSFNVTHRDVIIATATHHRLPLIGTDQFPRAGGLMSLLVRRGRIARTSSILCRPHPQRCQSGRPAGATGDEILADHQPQDCESTRPHRSTEHARSCRRGHRMIHPTHRRK